MVKWPKIVKLIVLTLFFIFVTFPIYWIVITSFKPESEIFRLPIRYFPVNFTFSNYLSLINDTKIPLFFLNSLIVSSATAIFVLVISIFSGYSLSRFQFKGRGTVFGVFLLTQMFPLVLLIVPLFVIFSKFHLIDTLYSLIFVYTVFNIPFCSFLMKGFFDSVPKEIEEYALIDGCGRVSSLFRVVLPVMIPGMVATFIFAFISAWNELIFGVVFLNSESVKTLPVGLNFFIQKYDISWGLMSAGAVISLIPIFIMFGFIQKFLVEGLTQGAIK